MSLDYKENFEQIKVAGRLAAKTLDEVTKYVKPGVSTEKLDKICYEFIKDNGGFSAPLFYKGFPKSSCTSVNHVVCHGIPTEKYLEEGHFGVGSMEPKIKSAIYFLEHYGKKVVLTSLKKLEDALKGNSGTTITKD